MCLFAEIPFYMYGLSLAFLISGNRFVSESIIRSEIEKKNFLVFFS